MKYLIKKPNLDKLNKKEISEALISKKRGEIIDFVKRVNEPDYLYWEKAKHKKPSPRGIEPEILWMITKFFRESSFLPTPVKDIKGGKFSWIKLPAYEKFFHELDLNMGGKLAITKKEVDIKNKQKFISRGIMEEAIASSQLEGAVTTRKAAKKMIKEGRKPRNKSEQMIANNYKAILALEEDYKNKEMSMSLILELHEIIIKDIKDSDGKTPKMRGKTDKICVVNEATNEIYHEAPDIDFVKKELNSFISFANNKTNHDYFIHPAVCAIMLHFWIGYLHPFTDGNGRLARLLFYWYLLRHDYWAFAYLPVSTIIKKSPIQYKMAYIYSEQDDNDLTYFIDYNIKKIKQAMVEFKEYAKKQSKENKTMNKIAKTKYKFNERQIQTLQYLYGAPDERTNMKNHMNVFRITKMTAIKDLKDLEKNNFLFSQKESRNIFYYPTEKIKILFKK